MSMRGNLFGTLGIYSVALSDVENEYEYMKYYR